MTAPVFAASENGMMPGEELEFLPKMGAYTFYAVISDGSNGWSKVNQTAWQLSKNGVSYALELSLVSGVATEIAVGAAATASAAAAGIVAAPAVVAAASSAVFWGTALCSSMAVSSLTGNSMDWVRTKMEQLGRRAGKGASPQEAQGLGDHGARLFCFDDVVSEREVRDAFCKSFPGVVTSRVFMAAEDVEAFYKALDSKYSDWRVVQGSSTRHFVITGGFAQPVSEEGADWQRTRFVPLAFGELEDESAGSLFAGFRRRVSGVFGRRDS